MNFQYRLLRLLNRGGHADLYESRNANSHPVAVKVLRDYKLPHEKKAFSREIRLLNLKLPGFIPLLDWNLNAEPPFYVMPLMGSSLKPYAGILTDDQLLNIAINLANALAELHATRDAHGDIKPDNILLTSNGCMQVADPLGNGAHCTVLFAENHGGTPGYWAPEIRAKAPISSVADIYSYGATLYELLTGKRPSDGQRLDPTTEGYQNAPRIRELITICCNTDPRKRPTIQQLIRVLNGEKWTDIQFQQQQSEALLTGVCVAGAGILLFGAFFGRR
jgi:serine/threonine protein kinase